MHGGRQWCGANSRMAEFRYQTFSAKAYQTFYTEYTRGMPAQDFGKPGMDTAGPEDKFWFDGEGGGVSSSLIFFMWYFV